MRGQPHAPAALYPRERPGTHCTGSWVGPRAGLDRWGKSRPPPTGIWSPDRPARSQSLDRLSYPAHLYYIGLCKYTFAQRRNRLATHFSERFLVVKRRVSVMLFSLAFIFCARDGRNITVMYFPYMHSQAGLNRDPKCGPFSSRPWRVRGLRYVPSVLNTVLTVTNTTDRSGEWQHKERSVSRITRAMGFWLGIWKRRSRRKGEEKGWWPFCNKEMNAVGCVYIYIYIYIYIYDISSLRVNWFDACSWCRQSAITTGLAAGTVPRLDDVNNYRVIKNDCRGFNNLSYTIHLR